MKERASIMENVRCCGKSRDHTKSAWKCLKLGIKDEKQKIDILT